MIEVYKILSGKYDSAVAPVLITNDTVTRGKATGNSRSESQKFPPS